MNKDIPSLTGIRALAAAWVVLMHFSDSFLILLPSLAYVWPLVGRGNFGVDLFFLLSGLIMMHVYGGNHVFNRADYFQFVGKRFARIYPSYLVAFVGMILLVVGADLVGIPRSSTLFSMTSLPFEFSMLQAWGPKLRSWNYPAWSVSAEWFSYLAIFPAALWIYRRVRFQGVSGERKKLSGSILAAGLAVAFVCLLVSTPFIRGQPHALVRVSCEFLIGAMLYYLISAAGSRRHLGTGLLVAGVAVLTAISWEWVTLSFVEFWVGMLLVLCLILMGLGIPNSLGTNILGRQPWVYLGQISYSLYLTHALVQRVLNVVLPAHRFAESAWWVRGAVALGYGLALFMAAAALYHLVENPARRYLTKKFESRGKISTRPDALAGSRIETST